MNHLITPKLISLIAKNAILAFISIECSLLTIINFILWCIAFSNIFDEIADGVIDYFYLLDIGTNFKCIMLSFTTSYYYICCGGLDEKCQSF